MSTSLEGAWSRRRLLTIFSAAVIVALILILGLLYSIVAAFQPAKDEPVQRADYPVRADGTRGSEYRNAKAAEPMLTITEADLQPAEPSVKQVGRIVVPAGTTTGPADVQSGFPATPKGALGQLAAIVTTALSTLSVDQARDVFDGWAMPGARFESWPIAKSIQDFHRGAGTIAGDGSAGAAATPVGAQINATDGSDWTIACVQLDVTVHVIEETRFGYGHCERMQWTGNRWQIAPGKPPAPAPSTWPKSDRSIDAGWKTYIEQETH